MADPIKGKDYEKYSGDLRKGILLHRRIDTFTDSHPTTFKSAHRLFKNFGHYNGVINDVFYDHLLAKNWKDYHNLELSDYIEDFYRLIDNNFELLPERVQYLFPYMKAQNWLLSYQDIEGIEKILYQMSSRIKGDLKLNEAVIELREHYTEFENEFRDFFPEIKAYVAEEKEKL